MLTELLSHSTCAKCRVCCVFDKSDLWEMPIISGKTEEALKKDYPNIKLTNHPKSSEFKTINAEFDDKGLAYCPLLTENGCGLGEEKPFDCRIWPFRVMKKDNMLLLTLSPVCDYVSSLPVSKISRFVPKISEIAFEEAEKRIDTVLDYIEDYPVFAVKAVHI